MALNLNALSYPFDPTGSLTSNLITAEQQILTAVNWSDYQFIVPNYAPFFYDSLVVKLTTLAGVTTTLVEGVDYYACFEFISASRACAKPIWGGIQFINPLLAGVITLQYQTLGGIWTIDETMISQLLADRLANPRITAWEQVANPPVAFPVIDHEWDLVDLTGAADLVTAIGNLENALRTGITTTLTAHIANTSNPHLVTAAQVGTYTTAQINAMITALQAANGTTDNIPEGVTNLYFTQPRVLNTLLTGVVFTNGNNILASDSVVVAMGKLQEQITNLVNTKANSTNFVINGYFLETVTTLTMGTASTNLDLSLSTIYQATVSANTAIVFNLSNVTIAAKQSLGFTLITTNDATGGWAVAFPSNVQWANGQLPLRSTIANSTDEWYFFTTNGGVSWTGSLSSANTH